MRLEKTVKMKDEKRYTNYLLCVSINGKEHKIPIQPKTFGREWDSPTVRANYTLLDIISEYKEID